MATIHLIARTLQPVEEEFDHEALQIVLMDAMYEYIQKREDILGYTQKGFTSLEDQDERIKQVSRKVKTAQSITNLFVVKDETRYDDDELHEIALKNREKIRRVPNGRFTEAEALYVWGRHLASKNDGMVPSDMREWWRSIDAIAPSWLTSQDLK